MLQATPGTSAKRVGGARGTDRARYQQIKYTKGLTFV